MKYSIWQFTGENFVLQEFRMNTYINWVVAYPFYSAFIQFAMLGLVGELIPIFIKSKKMHMPFSKSQLFGKAIGWGLLGLLIKAGFMMMKGATHALIDGGLLPQWFSSGIGWAFAVSVITNLFFGPQMMFFHRLEDNIILRERNWGGLTVAWWTLIWFWIPAHTITFSLPKEYQIGLAAIWSVVLGIVMGFTRKK
jgi:hypothetical protein